jgi:MerR family transcriptional regulator, thiopeptide resistance regulator
MMFEEAGGSELYRIGKFARLAGVTVKALRHYERLGLLRPYRTESGYRMYWQRDLECVEQIVALRFLGLSLRQIQEILGSGGLELPEALRFQRQALERRQRLLGRAIAVIREAEGAAESGVAPRTEVLRRIIKVIHMQKDFELLEQYYTDESLARWKDFFCQAEAASLACEDPAGQTGLALVERWVRLTEKVLANPQVYDAIYRAYCDRANWPPGLRQRISDFMSALRPYQMDDRLSDFLQKAYECHREKFYDNATWKSFYGGPLS